jgi:hypothetical protein
LAESTGIVRLEDDLTELEQARALACANEVEAVLRKYGCKIVTAPVIAGSSVFSEIHILPNAIRRV